MYRCSGSGSKIENKGSPSDWRPGFKIHALGANGETRSPPEGHGLYFKG